MAVNHWQVDISNVERLVEKLKQIEDGSEKIINSVIHNEGIKMATDGIKPEIPTSKWKHKVRKKKHAKNFQSLTSKKSNLAFTIRPQKRFEYLKYPDLGIGTSKKKQPQHFMKKGIQKATPKIINKLSDRLDQHINQTLGGN